MKNNEESGVAVSTSSLVTDDEKAVIDAE